MRVSRRRACGLFTALMLMPGPAVALRPLLPPALWVRHRYEYEIARMGSAASDDALGLAAIFAPELSALWLAGRADPNQIRHVLFGMPLSSAARVTLGAVSLVESGSRPLVRVDLTIDGVPRQVAVHLILSGEPGRGWLIANIAYDRGDDLLTHLRKRAGR